MNLQDSMECVIFVANIKNNDITMIIRLEETKDYREVENLTREAFWNVYRPGGYEE